MNSENNSDVIKKKQSDINSILKQFASVNESIKKTLDEIFKCQQSAEINLKELNEKFNVILSNSSDLN